MIRAITVCPTMRSIPTYTIVSSTRRIHRIIMRTQSTDRTAIAGFRQLLYRALTHFTQITAQPWQETVNITILVDAITVITTLLERHCINHQVHKDAEQAFQVEM